MQIKAEEFDTLRGWLALVFEHALSPTASLSPEHHPIFVLDTIAHKSSAQGRKALQMAIGDCLELTAGLRPDEIAKLDDILQEANVPTLSGIRLRFTKQIQHIIARGFIRSEDEYYVVRNAVEAIENDLGKETLWMLLTTYEEKLVSLKP